MAAFALTRKHPVRIMAKKSLLEIPVIGWFMENGGVIGVDRGNADINAIKRSLRVLKDGYPMMIFPEGTRVKEIGARGEAHTGPVMLAMKTGVPLLPMYIPQGKKPFRRSTIVIGEPYTIAPAGKRATNAELESAAAELLDKIYALPAQLLHHQIVVDDGAQHHRGAAGLGGLLAENHRPLHAAAEAGVLAQSYLHLLSSARA